MRDRKPTPRQRQVIQNIAFGLSTKETARVLGITPKTVEMHLYKIYRQLRVRDRVELVALAHRGAFEVEGR